MLTPDSSRFWPKDQLRAGHGQPSFDKQFVRDYLEEIRWNKQPPVPSLPDDVIQRTRAKYVEAFRLLTGRELQYAVREQLDSLVQQMLDRGVRYDDARREFEKVFITRALQRSNGERRRRGRAPRHPPQHGDAQDGGRSSQRAGDRDRPSPTGRGRASRRLNAAGREPAGLPSEWP